MPDPLTVVVGLTAATFALFGIGSPLLGHTVFAGTDLLGGIPIYRDAGLVNIGPHTINLGDTVDTAIPTAALFRDALWHGHFAGWNPYVAGGTPLGSTPNAGMLSPLSLPLWLLPTPLALGYLKLLEIVCAVGGSYLYLRRVRLGRPAALLGGLVFASSAFMVVWTNWPQSRTAAVIPVFFWALERLIQNRRPRDVALLALPVAAMLLGGFPSVTMYTLVTGACYLPARLFAEYRRQWRRVIGLTLAGFGAVVAGASLVGFQLVPWAQYMSRALIYGRDIESQGHIPFGMLVTTVAPFSLGTVNPAAPPLWYAVRIFIEENAYIGAGALLLSLVAVLLARRGSNLLPRGLWGILIAGIAAWGVLIFVGGPPLRLLQELSPIFAGNFIGRALSILGFLIAVLAAAGYELLLRRHTASDPAGRAGAVRRAVAIYVGIVCAGGLLAAVLAYRHGRDFAVRAGHEGHFMRQVASGLAIGAAVALCAGWLWWRRPAAGRLSRVARFAAAAAIPVLIGAQALMLVRPYYARSDPATFYPMTGAEAYLQQHLGHQRYFGATGAVYGTATTYHQLRGLQGHAFFDKRFGELLEALPGSQFRIPPTYLSTDPQGGSVVASPILDQLGVSHYVVAQANTPYGIAKVDAGDGSRVTIQPGQTLRLRVPATGALRGVGVTPVAAIPQSTATTRLSMTVRSSRNGVVAAADRLVWSMAAARPFVIPLAAEDAAPDERLSVDITLHSDRPLTVAGRDGAPALSTVAQATDGLRLVDDDGAAVYQRLTALPRARWASRAAVEPDSAQALRRLADGQVAGDEVLLDRPGPAAEGRTATVEWVEDGLDEMRLSVDAQGSGYLIVADAIRTGWTATVDGRPAKLVSANHGLVAVAVPAGRHTVRLSYAAAHGGVIGMSLTALTALVLLSMLAIEHWRSRRGIRRTTQTDPAGTSGSSPSSGSPTAALPLR